MYFQKPADATDATGGPGSSVGGAVPVNEPVRVPTSPKVPDLLNATVPPPPAITIPTANYSQPQPEPKPDDKKSTSQKKQVKIPPVPEEYTKLPPRQIIFMVYDDPQLERAIMERLIKDRIEDIRKQIKEAAAQKLDTKDLEKNLQELLAIKDPSSDPKYRFPPLPVISPPGVAYQPKTINYPPAQAVLEPGYVVHRRLHFEEKNAERQGWDLGPMQTLVSAAYFWKDALLWPQSLASGCVSGFWDTSAGKCLPGSPSPYYLYPPGLTITGTAVEGAIITGSAFILP
jgi:hypothetical protein